MRGDERRIFQERRKVVTSRDRRILKLPMLNSSLSYSRISFMSPPLIYASLNLRGLAIYMYCRNT